MKQDEAEKLARDILRLLPTHADLNDYDDRITILCNHILCADTRREIENAAFERATLAAMKMGAHAHGAIVRAIRALSQPPAQKENGE